MFRGLALLSHSRHLAGATASAGLLLTFQAALCFWRDNRKGLGLQVQKLLWYVQQRVLRMRLLTHNAVDPSSIRLVGGVDVSFVKGSETDACAALVVYDLTSDTVVYWDFKRVVLTAPYLPGFLAFREVDFLVDLLEDLRRKEPAKFPDAVLVDGNGMLHPHGFGLACHLGVLSRVPTVGVGKSLHHVDGLTKDRVRALAEAKCSTIGDHVALVGDSGRVWGAALRTTTPTAPREFKPVIVHAAVLQAAEAPMPRHLFLPLGSQSCPPQQRQKTTSECRQPM